MTSSYALIFALTLATYATRAGGHLVLSRFRRVDPRIEAALDAVPAAVLTAIVVPALATGAAEAIGLAFVVLSALRLPALVVIVAGPALVVLLRSVGL